MGYSDEEVVKSLLTILSDLVPITFGEGYELCNQHPLLINRRYSFMFRILIQTPAGELKPLRVKIHHDIWMRTLNQAIQSKHIKVVVQKEFQGMKYIEKVITESMIPNLIAIRPYFFIPELNAIVMEELPLEMMRKWIYKTGIILGKRKDWNIFENYLSFAGKWLRVFHGKSAIYKCAPLESINLKKEIDSLYKNLEKRINKPLLNLNMRSAQLIESLKKCDIPLSCLHHDYQLGNIFITAEGKLGALDPNWTMEGPIYSDLASFMIYPRVSKQSIITRGSIFRSSLVNRFEFAFLHGYFGNLEIQYPILFLFIVRAILKRWLEVEKLMKLKTTRNFPYVWFPVLWYIRSYFKNVIHQYLSRGFHYLDENKII